MTTQQRNQWMNFAAAAALLGACAAAPSLPDVPLELRPPAGEALVLVAYASGTQVYECAADAKAEGGYIWRFKGPQADLFDASQRPIGKHYGGPTWESSDGSKVVGEVKAQAPAADANAIPLLLLRAKSTSGDGVFTSVRSVQRLATSGGRAPASNECSAANASKMVLVPYKATYYFYGVPESRAYRS